jgi:uncharacterized membrane protein YfcA
MGTAALLVLAGFAAGVFGTVAGLASLASYPALLAAGLSPVSANVTNTVALVGNVAGTAFGSGTELEGQGRWIRQLGALTVLGGASGAALVLVTPSEGFAKVVPFLIAAASVLVLVRHRLTVLARMQQRAGESTSWGGRAVVYLTAVYGGYFGAGAGVVMLATLAIVTGQDMLKVNALKNIVLGMANGVAAIGFIIFGPVVWSAAIPLAIGCVGGGYVGPWLARRLPVQVLRILIAGGGFVLAIRLGWSAYQ